METVIEENPALGWRAIRLGLDRPAAARPDPRAAARRRRPRLRIMFPMISEVAEFDSAKSIVERETDLSASARPCAAGTHRCRHHGRSSGAALSIRRALEEVDFVSVGSNDLFQSCLRSIAQCQGLRTVRYHVCADHAVLREIVQKANVANKSASLCGEMASKRSARWR